MARGFQRGREGKRRMTVLDGWTSAGVVSVKVTSSRRGVSMHGCKAWCA